MQDIRAAWWLLPPRLRGNWRMLLVAAAGALAASTLLAAAPIYAAAMSDLGLQFRLQAALGDERVQSVTLEGLLASPQDRARREATARILDARLGEFGFGTASVDRSERLAAQLGAARPGDPADWAAFVHAIARLEAQVSVVSGRLPNVEAAVAEVALLDGYQRHAPLGTRISLQGGSFDDCQRRPVSEDPEEARAEVQCRPTTRVAQRFEAVVVGFVSPREPSAATWGLFGVGLEAPERPLYATDPGLSSRDRAQAAAGVGALPLLVPGEALTGSLSAAAPLLSWRHRSGFDVDAASIGRGDVDRALAAIQALRTDLEDRLDLSPSYALRLGQALEQFQGSEAFNQVPLLSVLLQIAGIALYYLVIVSQVIVEREADELGVLGSRGASTGQVVAVHTLEACGLAVPAALAAPFVAAWGVSLLGATPAFESITHGQLLATHVSPLAFLLAAGAAILAVAAVVLPVLLAAGSTLVASEAAAARPAMRSAIQRYYLDLAVVALAALLLWELRRRGTVFAGGAVSGWSGDPLLLASPFVFALAAAALLLRGYPPLLRITASVLALGRGTAAALGLRRAARSPAAYARLLLLLVLSFAVGTFAASYAPTVQAAREARARYETGAEVRLALSNIVAFDADVAAATTRSVPGVTEAALATRTVLSSASGTSFEALGVDAGRLSGVAWFREDFAVEPLSALALRLQGLAPPGGGIELPRDATHIEVSVFGDQARAQSVIWARVRDGEGRLQNLDLGGSESEGWRTLSAAIPEDLARPVFFAGLLITDARGVGVQRQGSLFFDDVKVTISGGVAQLIDDFEGRFGWMHFAAARSTERVERVDERAQSGSFAMRWQWTPGTPDGRRLLAVNPGNVPLSAILSEGAASALGATVGDVVALQLDGLRVPVAVRATAALFPTLSADPGFVVLNRGDLEALAALLETSSARTPGELWLNLEDGTRSERDATVAAVRAQLATAAVTSAADDTAATIDEARSDPTLQAAGSGILGAAFAAVLVLSILGFMVSVTARERSRLIEVAVLRAIGSSRSELLRSLAVEWGTVVAVGVIAGIVLGRRVASVMMSFLDVTETGARAVPPFVVQTSWATVGLGAFVLSSAIALGIIVVWRTSMRRADAARLRLTR